MASDSTVDAGMTDTERLSEARRLLIEIRHALDCARVGQEQGHLALREAGMIAAMLAAEAVVKTLGGGGDDGR